jgi:DNA-directed RNA polymerase specialized sigma24 family protein
MDLAIIAAVQEAHRRVDVAADALDAALLARSIAVQEAHRSGFSYTQIARACGVSTTSIWRSIHHGTRQQRTA